MPKKKYKAIEQYLGRLEQFNNELYEKYVELCRLLNKAPSGFDESFPLYDMLQTQFEFYGKTLEIFDAPKLSKIVIDNDFKIKLPFYHMEIELPPLPKTIYIFYLMHPQGVSNCDIPKYETCITEIYHNVSKYNDRADQDDTVQELINNRSKWTKNLNKLNNLIDNQLQEKHRGATFNYKIHFEKDLSLHKMYLSPQKIFLNQYLKKIL